MEQIRWTLKKLIEQVKVADATSLSDYLIAQGIVKWSRGHSARCQVDKLLSPLVATGQIEKCRGYYRLDSNSTYQPHSKLITQTILKILSAYPESLCYREVDVHWGRADIIATIRKGGDACVVIVECVLTEDEASIERKRNAWQAYEDALPFLRKLFDCPEIPFFIFLTHNQLPRFMEEELCD